MHRYILGVYSLYDRLTKAFPGVLFESCAGGGGRFDPGMLAFAPAGVGERRHGCHRTSEDSMGNVAAVPAQRDLRPRLRRAEPSGRAGHALATRAAVAFFGVLGYELDPTTLSAQERAEIADQVAFYKQWRELFQRGSVPAPSQPVRG